MIAFIFWKLCDARMSSTLRVDSGKQFTGIFLSFLTFCLARYMIDIRDLLAEITDTLKK